jgi:hypothetical protein
MGSSISSSGIYGSSMKALWAQASWVVGRMACSITWVCLLAWSAQAATVNNLYEASVPIERGRDAALQEALRTVLVRASGRRDAPNQLGAALTNPRQYMRFESTAAGTLTAGFDSGSVDKLLADAGLPIWGRERPSALIWLRINEADGTSRWVTDVPSLERDLVVRTAQARGLPIVWPRGEAEEQSLAAASTDAASLLQMATRYGANAVLLGQARRDGLGGLRVRWTLASGDGAADAEGGLEEGVHLAADTFARAYAASGGALADVRLEVSGVSDLNAYAETLNYLEGLTLVRAVAVEEVAGDVMRFKLTVRGNAQTLTRAIALGNRLAQRSESTSDTDRLAFRYLP